MKEGIEILDKAMRCLGEPPFGEGIKMAVFNLQKLEDIDCEDWPEALQEMREALLEDCDAFTSLMREPISYGNVESKTYAIEKHELTERIAQQMEVLRGRLEG